MLTSESCSGSARQRTHLISISSSFGSDSSFPIAPLDFRARVQISYVFSDFTTILFVCAPEIVPKSLKKEKYQVFHKWPFFSCLNMVSSCGGVSPIRKKKELPYWFWSGEDNGYSDFFLFL